MRFSLLAALFGLIAAPLAAQTVTAPYVYNANGQKVTSMAVVCVDLTGAYTGCTGTGSGGGGGGGAVTAANGSYVAGSIVDLGTGASPAANTVNARLAALLAALGSPVQAGTTIPVSNASLPLPAGAATSAKQAALGTAGTPSADVLSIQGVAGGVAQNIAAASLPLPAGASTETTLAAMSAKLPSSVGTKTMGFSISTGPASDGVWTVQGARSATLTDGSGTLTTAATSQQIFALNGSRTYLYVQNPITATETLFVNIGTAASTTAGSWELAPGGSLTFHSNFIPTGIVYVTAATAGHRWIAKSS